MTKISGYPEDTNPTNDDFVIGLDSGTSTTKKVKWLNIIPMIVAGGLTKATDANGWTAYNFGAWSEYRKRLTYSINGQGPAVLGLSSTTLPVSMATLGNNFISGTLAQNGNAYAVNWNFEMTSSSSAISVTYYVITGPQTQSGFIDVVITTP